LRVERCVGLCCHFWSKQLCRLGAASVLLARAHALWAREDSRCLLKRKILRDSFHVLHPAVSWTAPQSSPRPCTPPFHELVLSRLIKLHNAATASLVHLLSPEATQRRHQCHTVCKGLVHELFNAQDKVLCLNQPAPFAHDTHRD